MSDTSIKSLFAPVEFGGMKMRNRIVRSATCENMANADRTPSRALLDLYEALADEGPGLIMTSSTRADRTWEPPGSGTNMCLDRDESVPAFTELAGRIQAGGARAVVQLGPFFRYRDDFVGPSALPYAWAPPITPRALRADEIHDISAIYGRAAERARRAGFDAVQLHAAHGFPLCDFLSPRFNRRDDEYGGSPENRARIVTEIADSIGKSAGRDFPVLIKINVADFCPDGMTVDDAVETARVMIQNGISAIETSGGTTNHEMTGLGSADPSQWTEGYFLPFAERIRAETRAPIIAVGGLRDPDMMQAAVDQGKADLTAMSRPFINEPRIVKRWLSGDRRPTDCISCNGCMDLFMQGQPIRCVLNEGGM
ncbi:MAG: NADH:flavin oxidoreductase [Proteobacteria bacterium]|nr:NADH:flavin oxidoreductase [Pseudomonadota bacterium]